MEIDSKAASQSELIKCSKPIHLKRSTLKSPSRYLNRKIKHCVVVFRLGYIRAKLMIDQLISNVVSCSIELRRKMFEEKKRGNFFMFLFYVAIGF